MPKLTRIRNIVFGSLILLSITIGIAFLNVTPPLNNPTLIYSLTKGLSYTFISILLICLITYVFRKLFRKFSIIHKATLFLLLTIPLFLFATTIDDSLITKRIFSNNENYPSYNICFVCKYTRGDFIAWYDKSGNIYLGELVAADGDEVKINDGTIFINGIDSTYKLMSGFDKNVVMNFKLSDHEYLSLQGLYPRTLTDKQVNIGRIDKKYIAGKVTEIVSGVNSIIKTPKITITDEFSQDEIKQYHDLYSSPEAIFLRKVFNDYLGGVPNKQINRLATNSFSEEGYTFGLDSFEKSYYKSKFIIIGDYANPNGGKDLLIFFIDKQDRLFNAQVVKKENGLELRTFYSENKEFPPSPNRFTDYFSPFISDKEHSL